MICDFITGKTYEVTYVLSTQRVPRKFRAVFLCENAEGGELVFSGRPLFGTTQLPRKYVTGALETTGAPQLPRVARG